jgi:hypothetical protein
MSQVLRDISDAGQYAVGVEATADSPTLDPTALSIGCFAFYTSTSNSSSQRTLPNIGGESKSILFTRNTGGGPLAYSSAVGSLSHTIEASEAGINMYMGDGKWVGVTLESLIVS